MKRESYVHFKKTTTTKATGKSLKRFNEQEMAVHVRYNSWYISLPSSKNNNVK